MRNSQKEIIQNYLGEEELESGELQDNFGTMLTVDRGVSFFLFEEKSIRHNNITLGEIIAQYILYRDGCEADLIIIIDYLSFEVNIQATFYKMKADKLGYLSAYIGTMTNNEFLIQISIGQSENLNNLVFVDKNASEKIKAYFIKKNSLDKD